MAATTGSAGTTDKAVERIEEGAAASASGNAQVRNQFDAGSSAGSRRSKPSAVIDTSGTSRNTPDVDLRRGESGTGL